MSQKYQTHSANNIQYNKTIFSKIPTFKIWIGKLALKFPGKSRLHHCKVLIDKVKKNLST